MRKISSLNAALLLAVSFILLSSSKCKKDDAVKSKFDMLTQAGWKITKSEYKTSAAGAYIDITSTLPSCEKDDVQQYKTTGAYEGNEGATKCFPGDPQVYETGTWAFQNNDTEIRQTETGGTPLILKIEQLDENTLIVSGSENIGGTTYYSRGTFGH